MPDDRPDIQPPSDDEIHERLRKALEGLRGEETPFELSDEEVSRRASEMDGKVASAGRPEIPDLPEMPAPRTVPKESTILGPARDKSDSYLGLGVGISVAYSLIGLTVLGWGVGKLIDMRTGGNAGQALGTVLGATIGLAGGIMQIIRAQNKQGK